MSKTGRNRWVGLGCAAALASATGLACSAQNEASSNKPATDAGGTLAEAGATLADAGGTPEDAADDGSGCVVLQYHADTFSVGMKKQGTAGNFSFVLAAANPAPPDDPMWNTWTVQVVDATGNPVTDATVSLPVDDAPLGWLNPKNPWMPTMRHGSPIATTVTNSGGGTATVQLYFSMSGLWQTFVEAQSGTTVDSTTFSFCLP